MRLFGKASYNIYDGDHIESDLGNMEYALLMNKFEEKILYFLKAGIKCPAASGEVFTLFYRA